MTDLPHTAFGAAGPDAALPLAVGHHAQAERRPNTRTRTHAHTQPTTPTTADEHDLSSMTDFFAAPARPDLPTGPGADTTTNRESSATDTKGGGTAPP